jgi:photosystem II stability/assembly factor-like uncharacterized protein
MTSKVFVATTGAGLARAEQGASGTWTVTNSLPEQDVRCLAADPLNSSRVYAGLQGLGVRRSDDGGLSWRPAGLDGLIVKALAASPVTPGTVYAGTRSPIAIYVSPDGGDSWRELEGFRRIPNRWWWFSPAESPFAAYVQAIALSPTDPDVIVAGIEYGAVVRSEDGGRTWSGHRAGALRDCHSMCFHAEREWVYEAGGSGAGAAVSRDGGLTWKQAREGLDRHYGWACAADPQHPDIWYASLSTIAGFPKMTPSAHIDGQANAHIFRSMAGEPWQKLSGGLPDPLDYMAYALLTDPAAPGHLYAGLSNGDVWSSADYGDSWQRLPFDLGAIRRCLIMF